MWWMYVFSKNGPTPHPQTTDPAPEGGAVPPSRNKRDEEFTKEDNKNELVDIQAINILSQGLLRHIFNILNQNETGREIWVNLELLMKDYFVRFHKLVNDMKVTQLDIPTHQLNTKFANNLLSYREHALKSLKKKEQSFAVVDPLAYLAKTTPTHSTTSPVTFPLTNNQLRTSSNPKTHATVHDGQIVTETVQRRASGNMGTKGIQTTGSGVNNSGKKVICYNCRGEGHVARQCKEPKRPHASTAFMTNLSSTGGTNGSSSSHINKVQISDDSFFGDVSYPLAQEMQQEEHLNSEVDLVLDDNMITYDEYQNDSRVETVPTVALECNKVQHDLDMSIVERNKRNDELEKENVMLNSTLKSKVVSIENLQQESKQVLSEKKTLEDKYLEEIVVLTNANKVATNVLKGFQMPTHTIPMLSKRRNFASHDLHKTCLGYSNPSEESLVHAKDCKIKMEKRPGHALPINYAKLNAMYDQFVPQKELSREQVYWFPTIEIASQSSTPAKPVAPFVHTRPVKSDVHKKVMHAYYAKESLTLPPVIMPPSPMLSPMFNPQEFFLSEELLPPKKRGRDRLSSSTPTLPQEFEIGESSRLGKGRVIIQQDFDNLETELQETRAQVAKLQRKQLGQNNKIALDRFRINDLEKIIKEIQARHQADKESLLGETPKPSPRFTKKPVAPLLKKPNVNVPLSTGIKSATGASKPTSKSNAWIFRKLPAKSAKGEKVEEHIRNFNKNNRVDSHVKHSVFAKNLNVVCGACHEC
nr:hypothetical protein [Tanacetum cinerariifolium]